MTDFELVDNYVVSNLTRDCTFGMIGLVKADLVEYFGLTEYVANNTVNELVIKHNLYSKG